MYAVVENMLKTPMCQRSSFSSLDASQFICWVLVCTWFTPGLLLEQRIRNILDVQSKTSGSVEEWSFNCAS